MLHRVVCNLFIAIALSAGAPAALADSYAECFLAADSGNYDLAYAKWRELAEQGDANAEFNLGLMYHSGLHVAFNEQEAVRWYLRAAEGGNTLAQEYMAIGYQEGWFGLARDEAKSRYWYRRLDGETDTASVSNSSWGR